MTDRLEEESEAREEILAAYDALCPGIIGNPYLAGHFPLPMQWMFLRGHLDYPTEDGGVFQSLYGGAAGGGKSDALLMAAAQHVGQPGYAALIFRRTFADLALPGAIMDRALDWWKTAPGVSWDGTNKTFRFPSGAKISFAYLQHGGDELRYQGAEFQYVGWDELTQFPNRRQYSYLLSRIRRPANSAIPLRSLSASNPGGPGHAWVAEDFDVENDGNGHPFYPARVVDNPYIDRTAYIAGLMHLHPTTRAQLLSGDWRAREPGDYFRREWFGALLDPATDTWVAGDCARVRWWDLAASMKEGSAHTAGVKMARHRSGVYAIEHCALQSYPWNARLTHHRYSRKRWPQRHRGPRNRAGQRWHSPGRIHIREAPRTWHTLRLRSTASRTQRPREGLRRPSRIVEQRQGGTM